MSAYISRSIEKQLIKSAKSFPVVMITGPRQVGKTTLLKMINSDSEINYVTLDDLNVRSLAIEDPELFLRKYKMPLIIDEFQYAPNLLSYIKIKVDEIRLEHLKNNEVKCNGLYYLTGSQLFHSMKNISESLAGRVGVLNLYGLTNREIENLSDDLFLPDLSLLEKRKMSSKLDITELFKKILLGGYPELYSNENLDREEFFSSYIKTYIERDIRELINVKDEVKFLKFISNVAARTGQELNINDICNSIEINNHTAENWLSILVSTGIVYLLQPYYNNDISRIVKRPKIYFMDTGLACYLAGYVDEITLEKSAYSGQIFETYVVTEIIKSFVNSGKDPKKYLYYYRDNNGKELDLIIVYNNVVYPLEIKMGANPSKDAVKNFNVVDRFGFEIGNGGVVCLKSEIFPIDDKNNFIPIECI